MTRFDRVAGLRIGCFVDFRQDDIVADWKN